MLLLYRLTSQFTPGSSIPALSTAHRTPARSSIPALSTRHTNVSTGHALRDAQLRKYRVWHRGCVGEYPHIPVGSMGNA
eukprot:2859165-Rhodomonas_salina.6